MNSEWAEQPKSKVLPGAQLAAQREAMGLTVDQIADQLKLAPRQVVALEADDYDSLPNMAVTRGFVRAYAKVVKLDAAPLVAMIQVNPVAGHEHPQPARREISASFTESRFPTMTERSGKPSGWLLGAAGAAVIAAAVGAYYVGLFPNLAPGQKESSAVPVASVPAAVPAAPDGASSAPLQSPNVPLISVAPPVDPNAPAAAPAAGATPATQPAPQGVTPGAAPVAASPSAAAPAAPVAGQPPAAAGTPAGAAVKPGAPVAPPAGATVPAAGQPAVAGAVKPATPPAAAPAPGGAALVLTATEDSWITIQPPGKKALVSRMLKAGSTETFDVPEPALLIVGKPTGVKATLHGAALDLPAVPGGTISRVNIK